MFPRRDMTPRTHHHPAPAESHDELQLNPASPPPPSSYCTAAAAADYCRLY